MRKPIFGLNMNDMESVEMDYDSFVKKVKEAKKIQRETGGICTELRLQVDALDKRKKKIVKDFTCTHCGHREQQCVYVTFKEIHTMTIFETALLWLLFYRNELPHDYAGFHNCIAGKRFIENIEEIRKY